MGLVRARRSARELRVESCVGVHHRRTSCDMVVLPTTELLAASIGGAQPQILLSAGLVAALEPGELRAVVRHEEAHIRHRHHRYLLLASAVDHAFAYLPLVRRSTDTMRGALERWADEDAAGTTSTERVDVRAALQRVTALLLVPYGVSAFSGAETILERLEALDRDAPHPPLLFRVGLYAPGTAFAATALIAVGMWAGHAQAVVAMSGRCLT